MALISPSEVLLSQEWNATDDILIIYTFSYQLSRTRAFHFSFAFAKVATFPLLPNLFQRNFFDSLENCLLVVLKVRHKVEYLVGEARKEEDIVLGELKRSVPRKVE